MDFNFTPFLLYWGIGAVFFGIESLVPARPLSYRAVLFNDVVAFFSYQLFFYIAVQITDRIPIPNYVPWRIQVLPFVVKLVLFMLVADCGAYWMHRLWHTKWLWRTHKWHHSPTDLYWLAGIRASFPQVVMANLPFVIALPLLKPVPSTFFALYPLFMVVTNNWMHMNVTWPSRWLEWVVVTPRYHHLHHSDDPALYTRNLGVIFTFWDRLFGTYTDPERVGAIPTFGIKETVSPIRLAIGI